MPLLTIQKIHWFMHKGAEDQQHDDFMGESDLIRQERRKMTKSFSDLRARAIAGNGSAVGLGMEEGASAD